jgi:hypothetical protein
VTNAEYIRGRYFDWLVRQRRDRRPRVSAREYEEYTKPLPELVPARVEVTSRRRTASIR